MLAGRRTSPPRVCSRGFFLVEAIVALGIVSICAMIIGRVTESGRGASATNLTLARNLIYARAGVAQGFFDRRISREDVREAVTPFCSSPDGTDCPAHLRPYQQHSLSVGRPPAVITLLKFEARPR